MRVSVSVMLALLIAGAALAQMGPEMMGMGGMGGGFAAPTILDVGPVISPDGKTVMFSRVTASKQGNDWVIASVQGGMGGGMMGGMGPEGGMMGGGMMPGGMMGPEGGMMGMGGGGAKLDVEGLFEVPVGAGGKPGPEKAIAQGRAVIQNAGGGTICYSFQGKGTADYANWGIWGTKFSGADNARWYPAPTPFPWIRVSPDGQLFVLPYEPIKAVVFFPAQANTQQNAGYIAVDDRKTAPSWLPSNDGIWVVREDRPAQPGQPGGMMGMPGGGMGAQPGGMMPGGMMPGGMMPGGMMGPEGGMMGGMGMAAAAPKYHIAKATKDQKLTDVIMDVAKDSLAASIPNSTDIAVSMGKKAAAAAGGMMGGGMMPGGMMGPEMMGGGMMGGAPAAEDTSGLYVYTAAGEQKQKLSNRRALYLEPSPDGKFIAFMWGEKAPYNLSIAPVDGRPVRGVSAGIVGLVGGSIPFSWSADSKKLAFAAEHHNGNGVFLVDIETGKMDRISGAKAQTPAARGGGG